MSNSFYGGRDGRPMIIKKSFKYINYDETGDKNIDDREKAKSMTHQFANINYSEVGFGEYAIIESENKNNPENGRIFRRDKDFNSDRKINYWTKNETTNIFEKQQTFANGAVYVSQIVGPSGNAPHLTFLNSLEDVRQTYSNYEGFVREQITSDEKLRTKLRLEIRQKLFADGSVNNETPEAEIEKIIDGLIDDKINEVVAERITSLGAVGDGYDAKIASGERSASVGNKNLVPGKDGDKFNDEIKWLSCSIRDENQQRTDAYIGFEIPYTVIEWDAQGVDPYYNRSNETNDFINQNLITRHDEDKDAKHPFYQKWQIKIPKGIHGQSIEDIKVISVSEDLNLVKLTYNNDTKKLARDRNGALITEPYKSETDRNDDIQKNRKVIVCNFIDYDRTLEGELYTVYLGDYNMIENLTLEDNGDFTIQYSHNDDFERKNEDALNWLTGLNLTDGYITITTNNDNLTDIKQQLHWPIKININKDNGEVIYTDVEKENGTNKTYTQDKLTWVKSADITSDGKFQTITTTGNNQANTQLQWVKEININEDDGTVNLIDISGDSNKNISYEKLLTWIKNISITNGKIDIETNNDKAELHQQLNWIEDINIDPETGAITYQNVEVDENGNKKKKTNTLQWLKNINIDPDTGAVTASFTGNKADEPKLSLQWVKDISIGTDGTITTNYTNIDDKVESKKLKWPTNISIDAEGNVTTSYNNGNPSTANNQINWIESAELTNDNKLNIIYNNSNLKNITNLDLKAINNLELQDGSFYVTYNTGERVQMGQIDDATVGTIAGDSSIDISNLRDGGIWFVTEEENE